MNKQLWITSVALITLASCAAPPPTDAFAAAEQPAPTSAAQSPAPAPSFATTAPSTQVSRFNPVVASVGQVQVTRDQLIKPLVDAYGLNILLNVIQLEIAKQNASREHLVVTADDIQRERDQTINNMFKDANQKLIDKINDYRSRNMTAEAQKIQDEIKQDNDQAFDQFLANQHLSRTEFELLPLLARNRGRAFNRGYLHESLWHEPHTDGDRSVDNAVLRLRKKLGHLGDAIETVWGVGYRCSASLPAEPAT